MTEKDSSIPNYPLDEDVEIENIQPDPTGDVTLTISDGLFIFEYQGKKMPCAILALGKSVDLPVDRTPLKAFKKMGKLALYEVPEAGIPAPTKIVNFDNFVSGLATHADSRISAEGVFSIQGHKIPFYTYDSTAAMDHGPIYISQNEKFQKSLDNVRHIDGNEDAEKLIAELDSANLDYFKDKQQFAKKDVRVHEFQQVATGEGAIRKDILMFLPFKKFLPIIGMHLSPLRNTKQTRDLSMFMASKALLQKKEITVCGDGTYVYPEVTAEKEHLADVVLKLNIPAKEDEFKQVIRYLNFRKNAGQPFCMRLRLSPQVSWNKIHKKLPYFSYFRTGYLAGPYFGLYFDGKETLTTSPFAKMSILLSTETQIARYYLARDVLGKDVTCNFTKSVMAFSLCTDQEKGGKRKYLALTDFVLNAQEQPDIELAGDYELDLDEIPVPKIQLQANTLTSTPGPVIPVGKVEPPTQVEFSFTKEVAGSSTEDGNDSDEEIGDYTVE